MPIFPKLSSKFILAPMSGVSDVAFRALCRLYGAGLSTTELTAADAILNSKKSDYIIFSPEEQPRSLQLFGNDIQSVVQAAKYIEPKVDLLDFNFGCPAWNIVRQGCGSALLGDPESVGKIVKEVSSAITIPFTIKIRSGISNITCIEVATAAEANGASAVALHARTAKQGYSGKADWELITKVKEALTIPIIGNGDIWKPEDALRMLDTTHCDYVMIGRGAIGNPLIFTQCNDLFTTGTYTHTTPERQRALFWEYLDLATQYHIGFSAIKQQAMNFTKGIPDSTSMRDKMTRAKTREEIEALF